MLRTILEVFQGEHADSTDQNNKKKQNNRKTVDPVQRVVIEFSYGLRTIPCSIAPDTVSEVFQVLPSKADVDWMVAAATMLGAMNKLMDGLGIPLESETYAETAGIIGANYKLGAAGSILKISNRQVR